MGAYLSAPVTDKISSDVANDFMSVGSSSMQGWRRSQEDSHNVILDFDEALKASLFAVYDGHGGAEVAIFCSEKLPVFLKSLDKYKEHNFHEALINTFIGLDGEILKEETMEILKKIAGEKNPPILPDTMEDEEDDDEDDEEMGDDENLAELCQEGRLPLHEVLLKYGRPKNKLIEKVEDAIEPGTPGGSGLNKKAKPLSPFLRGKRESAGEISSSVGSSSGAGSSSSAASPSDDSAVSSSSQAPGPSKKSIENGSAEASPAKSIESKEQNEVSCSPDSSAGKKRNGTSSAEGQSSSADVSSSSSLSKENGEDSGVPSSAVETAENVDSNEHDESSESEDDDFNAAAELENSDSDADEIEYEEEEDEDDEEQEDFDGGEDPDTMIDVPGKDSGCTAVVALIVGKDLYVANAGDSRCVVCRNGKAIEMSLDHKPEDEEETKRIEKAGGKITLDGRVNGGLNLSRAIGDHTYKKNKSLPLEEQMISAMPDIRKIVITPEDEFMILACDGIWNFMSSEKVIQFVKERIDKKTLTESQICEELFDVCLAKDSKGDGTGCDNMTAVIVNFKEKILEQPTNLKPEEIETVFVVNKIETEEDEEEDDDEMDSTAEQSAAAEVSVPQQALKRSASPTNADENGEVDSHNHKRLKTEENGSSSTSDPDQSSINSTTAEGGNSKGAAGSLDGPQPSITTTTTESDSST